MRRLVCSRCYRSLPPHCKRARARLRCAALRCTHRRESGRCWRLARRRRPRASRPARAPSTCRCCGLAGERRTGRGASPTATLGGTMPRGWGYRANAMPATQTGTPRGLPWAARRGSAAPAGFFERREGDECGRHRHEQRGDGAGARCRDRRELVERKHEGERGPRELVHVEEPAGRQATHRNAAGPIRRRPQARDGCHRARACDQRATGRRMREYSRRARSDRPRRRAPLLVVGGERRPCDAVDAGRVGAFLACRVRAEAARASGNARRGPTARPAAAATAHAAGARSGVRG